ncbi:glycosyltransferase [Haladaptatus sp. DYSN1]|uniref:glycosyltransferase n=1 Tax=unclassified Haladaptatus TaxID=2622732 RepID=UPI0024069F96|nr:glycosyltransferase [Haladaptatus sp. DYSN1]
MEWSVGIVVPAFQPNVSQLQTFVRALDETLSPAVIRIELDDPRPGVVDALSSLPATVNAVDARRGKGAAIAAGFEALDTDVYAFADADGATPAKSIADVVRPVLEGRADLSVGSRRHPDAVVKSHQTLARRRLGDAFAWLARRLLSVDLFDYQCGAKAMTADAWAAVREHLYEPGFAWDVELIAMAGALGQRVAEVPVEWHDQPDSTVDPVGTTKALAKGLFVSRHRAKLVSQDRFHQAIANRRDQPTALIDLGPNDD